MVENIKKRYIETKVFMQIDEKSQRNRCEKDRQIHIKNRQIEVKSYRQII